MLARILRNRRYERAGPVLAPRRELLYITGTGGATTGYSAYRVGRHRPVETISEAGKTVNGDGGWISAIGEKTVPDVYSDSVRFEITVYGVTLEFGQVIQAPKGYEGPVPHRPRIRVHMSPQHAKVMAGLFVKNMRNYEHKVGTITIPEELLEELGLSDE